MKGLLDQGYYENGIYTAETEEELVRDIHLGLELGFNGARLHQKLFEPRFLYHCDRLGYMVWGEYPNWGVDSELISGLGKFIEEWTEAIERDINHPSIVTWCPLNEMWGCLSNKTRTREMRFVDAVYSVTKALDSSRPCVDTSGGHHCEHTDIFDIHTYMALDVFSEEMKQIEENRPFTMAQLYAPEIAQETIAYDGKLPIHISEYGGFTYDPSGNGWGYTSVKTEEEYVSRYEKHIEMMKESKKICGYCYTQLYDVEQEQNGIVYYNRKHKFSNEGLNRIYKANKSKAMIEGGK
jgi:beta-galactosidase/beta-glucuronidase